MIVKHCRHFIGCILAVALFATNAGMLCGQEQGNSPKAFFMVEIGLEKARKNALFADSLDKAPLGEFLPELYDSGMTVADIKSIRAAAAASVVDLGMVVAKQDKARSEKMQALGMFDEFDADTYDEEAEQKKYAEFAVFQQELLEEIKQQRPDFFLQIEFTSEKSAKTFIENAFPPSTEEETLNGKKVLRTPAGKMLGIYFDGKTNITVAADKYLFGESKLAPTALIEDYFSKHADRAFRIGVDLDAVRPQIAKIKELGEIPPMVFGIVDAIRSATVALDIDNSELANIVVNTDTESNAELIASQVNGALRSLKMATEQGVNQMFGEGSEEADALIAFVKSWNCDVDGASARMSIDKPAGFDAIVKRAVQEAQAAAQQTSKMNDFRQVSIGLLNCEAVYRKFPFGQPVNDEFSKDLSWRVVILPYMESANLFDQFKTDEAWDSENNRQFVKQMPVTYGHGSTGEKTDICWIKSKDESIKVADIVDGMSNTIMLMENPNKVTWSKPDDLSIDEAVNLVKNLEDGEKLIIGLYDGSVMTVSNQADMETFKAMLTIDGGEIVDTSKIK